MYSNTFKNICAKNGDKHCSELSKGDAYNVIHEITKVRTLNSNDKFGYIKKFIEGGITVATLKHSMSDGSDSDIMNEL
jgi:hypothetical protein